MGRVGQKIPGQEPLSTELLPDSIDGLTVHDMKHTTHPQRPQPDARVEH